jgi:hypothetical protein
VGAGHDEDVAASARIDVHERHGPFIGVNELGWEGPGHDLAEHAIALGRHRPPR